MLMLLFYYAILLKGNNTRLRNTQYTTTITKTQNFLLCLLNATVNGQISMLAGIIDTLVGFLVQRWAETIYYTIATGLSNTDLGRFIEFIETQFQWMPTIRMHLPDTHTHIDFDQRFSYIPTYICWLNVYCISFKHAQLHKFRHLQLQKKKYINSSWWSWRCNGFENLNGFISLLRYNWV